MLFRDVHSGFTLSTLIKTLLINGLKYIKKRAGQRLFIICSSSVFKGQCEKKYQIEIEEKIFNFKSIIRDIHNYYIYQHSLK
jgi:hypothetical protein